MIAGNPWVCDNPALRQMTLVSQSNSYRKALVTYLSLTDYMCACTPTNYAPVKYYLWLINHNEFYFCEQNARFSQIRKEPPIIVYKNRIINHVTITMELIWENFKPVFKKWTTWTLFKKKYNKSYVLHSNRFNFNW